jgi:hypothetical protein
MVFPRILAEFSKKVLMAKVWAGIVRFLVGAAVPQAGAFLENARKSARQAPISCGIPRV